jgi:hypothetical protein
VRGLVVEAAEQLARGGRYHGDGAQLQALTDDSAADRAAQLAAAGLTPGQLAGARQVLHALIGMLDG